MSKKFHIGKNGPAECKATVRACRYGDEGTHFKDMGAAQRAYEKQQAGEEGSFSTHSSLVKRLQGSQPHQVDEEAAALMMKRAQAEATYRRAQEQEERAHRYLEYGQRWGQSEERKTRYQRELEEALKIQVEAQAEMKGLTKALQPYHDEYTRRGGWSRAYLVTGGHLHSSTACSTCFPTTSFHWLPSYSGKSEDELVEDAGERACTVCYPSAPVEALQRKSKLFTPDEEAAEARRKERAEAAEAKRAKAAAAGITSAAGGELRVPTGGRWEERVKTERTAQIMAVDAAATLVGYEATRKEGGFVNEDSEKLYRKQVAILVEALARKRGLTLKEVEEDIFRRGAVKHAAWLKEARRRDAEARARMNS